MHKLQRVCICPEVQVEGMQLEQIFALVSGIRAGQSPMLVRDRLLAGAVDCQCTQARVLR